MLSISEYWLHMGAAVQARCWSLAASARSSASMLQEPGCIRSQQRKHAAGGLSQCMSGAAGGHQPRPGRQLRQGLRHAVPGRGWGAGAAAADQLGRVHAPHRRRHHDAWCPRPGSPLPRRLTREKHPCVRDARTTAATFWGWDPWIGCCMRAQGMTWACGCHRSWRRFRRVATRQHPVEARMHARQAMQP